MSTINYALTTLAKVKLAMGITDSTKDTLIEMYINQASALIQNICGGRNFLSQTYIEIKDGKGHNKLFLNQYPATAVSLVEYRAGTPSTPNWTTLQADNYYVDLGAGIINCLASVPKAPQSMRVTYVAGYLIDFTNELTATHTLPFDLTGVATELVCGAMNRTNAQGISQQSTEGQSVTFALSTSDLTSTQKKVLASYTTMRYAI